MTDLTDAPDIVGRIGIYAQTLEDMGYDFEPRTMRAAAAEIQRLREFNKQVVDTALGRNRPTIEETEAWLREVDAYPDPTSAKQGERAE